MILEKKIIASFIEEKFGTETNIIIFGSVCNNLRSFKSDIDVLIISKSVSTFYKEHFYYQSCIFDVLIIPQQDLDECLEKDKYLKVYTDIFQSGIIYKQQHNYLTDIKRGISSSTVSDDIFLQKMKIDYKLKIYYNAFFESVSAIEAEVNLTKLCENILLQRLLQYGVSNIASTKHLLKFITIYDAKLAQEIFSIKQHFFTTGKPHDVKEEIHTLLDSAFWSENGLYCNHYARTEVYRDELILYWQPSDYYIIKKILNFLTANNYSYYIFSIDKNNINPQGKYIVVTEDAYQINQLIVPAIEGIIEDNMIFIQSYKVIFPYNLDLQQYLGIQENDKYQVLSAFFCQCSKINSKLKSKFEVEKIVLNTIIGLLCSPVSLRDSWFKNSSTLCQFFMSKAYNKDAVFSYNQYKLGYSLLNIKHAKLLSENQDLKQLFAGAIQDCTAAGFAQTELGLLIETFHAGFGFISEKKKSLQYTVFNMLLNIFEIGDSHKAYMFHIISENINPIDDI